MSDFNKRFILFLDYLSNKRLISGNADFARRIWVSSSMMTEVSKGRSQVGVKLIQNTVASFGLNPIWLLTGEGEMILDSNYKDHKVALAAQEPSEPYHIEDVKNKYIDALEELMRTKELIHQLRETIIILEKEISDLKGNDSKPASNEGVRNAG